MIIYNKIHGSEFQWNIAVLILILATLVYIIPENCEYFILIRYSIPYRYSIFKKNPISFFPFIVQLRNFSLIFADNYYHIYILSKKEPGTIPLPLKSIYLRRFFEISPSSFLVFFLHFFLFPLLHTSITSATYMYVFVEKSIEGGWTERYCEILRTIDTQEFLVRPDVAPYVRNASPPPFKIVFNVMFLY